LDETMESENNAVAMEPMAVEGLAETITDSQVDQAVTVEAEPKPLDPSYIADAGRFNMTEADLRALPQEVVRRIIAGADRATLEAFRREQRTPYGPAPTVPAPASISQEPFAIAPFELTFDGEEEEAKDSPVAKKLAALNKHYGDQSKRQHDHYQNELKTLREAVTGFQQQAHYGVLDRFIEGLGTEWSGLFGKGTSTDLDSRSQEFLKRDELGTAAIEHRQIHERLTGRPLPVSEALRRALHSLHYDKASAIERAKADATRAKLAAGASDRPKPGMVAANNGGIRSRSEALLGMARRR
jgi:hypothetical protein